MKKLMFVMIVSMHACLYADMVDKVAAGVAATLVFVGGTAYWSSRVSNGEIIARAQEVCDRWEKAAENVDVHKDQIADNLKLADNVKALGCNHDPLQAPRKVSEAGAGLHMVSKQFEDRFTSWAFWNRYFVDENIDELDKRLQKNVDQYVLFDHYFKYHAEILRKMKDAYAQAMAGAHYVS